MPPFAADSFATIDVAPPLPPSRSLRGVPALLCARLSHFLPLRVGALCVIAGLLAAAIAPEDAQAAGRGRGGRAAKAAAKSPQHKARPAAAAAHRGALASRFLPSRAASGNDVDEAFLSARRHYAANDSVRFEQAAAAAAQHPLADYLSYWRLSMALRASGVGEGTDAAVVRFLGSNGNLLLVDQLRRDYMLSLARRERWDELRSHYVLWVGRDDAPAQCFAWTAQLAQSNELPAEARAYLMQPRELGDGCNPLMQRAYAQGQLSRADLRRRLRLSFESGAAATGRRVAALLGAEVGDLEAAFREPARVLARPSANSEELIAAIAATARKDPQDAAAALRGANRLDGASQSFAWALIAAQGAQRLMPESVVWARNAFADGKGAGSASLSDDTLAWLVRAALAADDWLLVSRVIQAMSDAGQQEPVWTYWQARAQRTLGQPAKAAALFQRIAGQPGFYGFLAAEESGTPVPLPVMAAPVTASEAAAARGNPGLARALKLYELGLRGDGNREWNFQLREMSDRELLAAADFACKSQVLDRCVNTADRTRNEHDYTLRFLAPYRDRLTVHANTYNLDPAFVYGLIRQESRFVTVARSHVGAQGLMQIMPATANWIARQLGFVGFHIGHLHDLDTNLRFGTFYLRDVARRFEDSQVLASAAYNAGPGRPARWRQVLSKTVDGALFAEIIPFDETRDYVKKVLWNATWYAAVFTGKPQSLRVRLGSVAPGASATAGASQTTGASATPGAGGDAGNGRQTDATPPSGRSEPSAAAGGDPAALQRAPSVEWHTTAADASPDRPLADDELPPLRRLSSVESEGETPATVATPAAPQPPAALKAEEAAPDEPQISRPDSETSREDEPAIR